MNIYKKHKVFKSFLTCCCLIAVLSLPGSIAAADPIAPVLPIAPQPLDAPGSPSSQSISIQPYEVELGQRVLIPTTDNAFYLVNAPQIAQVIEESTEGLWVRGEKIGETLVLVRSGGRMLSYRIRVLRPSIESSAISQSIAESSPAYRDQKKRSFRASYEGAYSLLADGRVLPRVSEARKLFGHQIKMQGGTPVGNLKAGLFHEYRKEHSLEKSTSVPRDAYVRLEESNLPLLKRYDLTGGTQYTSLGRYSFPGMRYNGFSILPSLSRQTEPKRGQVDGYFFVGEKRDGSYIDNPSGIQNRELTGDVGGERIDYYLWKTGVISAGAAHEWNGPRTELQSKNNFDGRFDFSHRGLSLAGESGVDPEGRGAGELRAGAQNRFAGIDGRFFNVNNHYATITGAAENRGNRGFRLSSFLYPFFPIWKSDALALRADTGWTRNHFSVNPDRPRESLKYQRGAATVKLPWRVTSESSVYFLDQRASSFPYTQRRLNQNFWRSFAVNTRLLSRVRFGLLSTAESYRKGVNTQGFNSTRYELGSSAGLNFRGGVWMTAKYLWNQLKEEDLPSPPSRTTNPGQLTLSMGWSHAFRKPPVRVGADIRYVNEDSTYSRIHQPFINEDRLETHASVAVPFSERGEVFADSRILLTKSTVGSPDHAEFSLLTGVRMLLDSGLSIPQKGFVEGYVFEDRNANGVRDEGEPGVVGQAVNGPGGENTETDSKGFYKLKVREGLGKIEAAAALPEGFFYTTPTAKVTEVLSDTHTRLDFGMAARFQIKGRVFTDLNGNGIFDKADKPIAGVKLVLSTGQVALSSPSDGLYALLHIAPGLNKIRVAFETIPAGYQTKTAVEKSFDGAAGDILHFDLILQPSRQVSGDVFEDLNQNSRREPDEPGVAGAEIDLCGKKTASGRTGRFASSGLEPGACEVQLMTRSLPSDYRPIGDTAVTLQVPDGPYQKRDLAFPLRKKT